MAFRVTNAKQAYKRALELSGCGFDNHTGLMELNIPAIKGIGDSLIYSVDRWQGKDDAQPGPRQHQHLRRRFRADRRRSTEKQRPDLHRPPTHNVHRGQHGGAFQDIIDTYDNLVNRRLPNYGENLEELRRLRIVIDGATHPGVFNELLLQIFTQTVIEAIFFEIIQRKGDQEVAEGNFRVLFESIKLDQVRRGVLVDKSVAVGGTETTSHGST